MCDEPSSEDEKVKPNKSQQKIKKVPPPKQPTQQKPPKAPTRSHHNPVKLMHPTHLYPKSPVDHLKKLMLKKWRGKARWVVIWCIRLWNSLYHAFQQCPTPANADVLALLKSNAKAFATQPPTFNEKDDNILASPLLRLFLCLQLGFISKIWHYTNISRTHKSPISVWHNELIIVVSVSINREITCTSPIFQVFLIVL